MQVTTKIGSASGTAHGFQKQQQQQQLSGSGRQQQQQGQGGQVTAALGTKWAHCVNVRLALERLGDQRYLKVSGGAPRNACSRIWVLNNWTGLNGMQWERGGRAAGSRVPLTSSPR